MASEIGTYYLSITAATQGFAKDIEKALGGLPAVGEQAGTKTGEKLGTKIINLTKQTLSTGARILGGVAMAGIGVAVGTAITGGISRSINIENAQKKLEGLGYSASDVTSIMGSALASVKGTAYGLGDAATVAAMMGSAGVKSGQDMTAALTAVADVAAQSGSSLTDVGTIFAAVSAKGKLTGQDMLRLTSAGVPVLEALAQHYGITAAAASDMVSKGKVDFASFQQAMTERVGGSALKMGETFTGSVMNIKAALGRLGEVAATPALGMIKTLFNAAIPAVDNLTTAFKPLVAALADRLAPAVQKVVDWLGKLNFKPTADGANGVLNALGPLLPVFLGLGGAMGPLLAKIPMLGSMFAGLSGPVGIMGGALLALGLFKPETLMSGFDSLATSIPGIIDGLVAKIVEFVPQVVARMATNLPIFITGIINLLTAVIPAITTAIPLLVDAVCQLIPNVIGGLLAGVPALLNAALGLFNGIWQALPIIIPQVLSALVGMVPKLASTIVGQLPQIVSAAVSLFTGLVSALVTVLPTVVQQIVTGIMDFATAIIGELPTILDAGLTLFLALVDAVVADLPVILDAVISMVPALIAGLLSTLPNLIQAAVQLFLGLVTGLGNALPQIITSVVGMVPKLVTSLVAQLPQIITGAIQLFVGIVTGLIQAMPQIVSAVIGMIPSIVSALISAVPQLVSAGAQLVAGVVRGLWSAAGSVGSALLSIAKSAVSSFLSFLGIHSPSTLFAGFGINTMEGFAVGIEDQAKDTARTMAAVASDLVDSFTGSFTIPDDTIAALSATADVSWSTTALDSIRVPPVPVVTTSRVDLYDDGTGVGTAALLDKLDQLIDATDRNRVTVMDSGQLVGATQTDMSRALGDGQDAADRRVAWY